MVRARLVVWTETFGKLTGAWQFTQDVRDLAAVARDGLEYEIQTLITDDGATVFRTDDVVRVDVERDADPAVCVEDTDSALLTLQVHRDGAQFIAAALRNVDPSTSGFSALSMLLEALEARGL